ncbi:serine/threonine-protein kinase [Streptomyces sp. NPDC051183]|uniref:WD40 repeat domain-containing serine/threonine protein kinase n=1 Tax=Streptomyces sp. NPDC051183 TaxID=3155165 RepID=UPI00341CE923
MRTGERFSGRYRLVVRLGHGGIGEVWEAYDTELERPVALKVLLEFDAAEELLRRFRREAAIGARLRHPGITVVHDIGQHENRLFIVMELLEGRDLAQVLRRSPGGLPVPEAVDLAVQAAEALAAAHAQQVVHRDLKPANLFLLTEGRLKICDFGIARTADATGGLTVTGRPFGTPPYMAPEQWRGEHVDARCDLYALGCVLHALLTGDAPFPATEQPWVLMRRHLDEVPPPLRSVRADVPAGVEELVSALLAKDPAERPDAATTARRLLALRAPAAADLPDLPELPDLPTATALPPRPTPPPPPTAPGTPPPATPPAAAPRTPPPATPPAAAPRTPPPATPPAAPAEVPPVPSTRPDALPSAPGPNRRSILLAGLGTLALASGGTYAALHFAGDKDDGKARESGGGSSAGGVTPLVSFTDITGSVESVAFAPDGRMLAGGTSNGTLPLWQTAAAASAVFPIPGHANTVSSVAFSPDGKTLASGSLDNTVQLVAFADPTRVTTLRGHTSSVWSVAFSPDGKSVASGSWDHTVRLWRVSDGAIVNTLTGHTASVWSVAFSPDGDTVAGAGDDGTVRLWNIVSGGVTTLTGHSGGVVAVAFGPDGKSVATGGNDSTVRLWNLADGTGVTLPGHTGALSSVAFSPDGRTVASGGNDNTVRLWRVADHACTATLSAHTAAVRSVAFSPDGTTLASGGMDKAVRLWKLP